MESLQNNVDRIISSLSKRIDKLDYEQKRDLQELSMELFDSGEPPSEVLQTMSEILYPELIKLVVRRRHINKKRKK